MRTNDAEIHRIIDEEDIEGLLALGSPSDEYEGEAARICDRLHQLSASQFVEERVMQVVADVWQEMFSPFDDAEWQRRDPVCRRIAQRIIEVHEHQ